MPYPKAAAPRLANPQNLDITALLVKPSASPFAQALRAAQVVLVVPNRHQSVYTRLWCPGRGGLDPLQVALGVVWVGARVAPRPGAATRPSWRRRRARSS